jgi:hypothetical protein
MFSRKNIVIILFVGIIVTSTNVIAQDNLMTVILSPFVGSSIDLSERNRYSLFPQYEFFDSAIVYKVNSESYFIRFRFHNKDGAMVDSSVSYSESLIKTLSEKINHYDELKRGIYKIGDSEVNLGYIKSNVAVSLPPAEIPISKHIQTTHKNEVADKAWSDELPFSKNADEEEFPRHSIAFGISISTISYNFDAVNEAFTAIENKYRDQGHTITPHIQEIKISPWIGSSLQIRLYNDLHLMIETGNPITSRDQVYGKEKFYMVSGSLLYHYYPTEKKWMRTYLSIGVGKYYYEIIRNYGINNRISEIFQDGSYNYLENLSSSGGSTGYPLSCGIEFIGGSGLACSLFANYTYAPPIDIQLVDGRKSAVRLSGARLCGRVSLYF